MKYIIEVPDDMEYARLTGGVRGVCYSLEIEFAKLEKAEPHWIPVTKEEMFKAGYESREIRFRVDGRLFAIRELAQ